MLAYVSSRNGTDNGVHEVTIQPNLILLCDNDHGAQLPSLAQDVVAMAAQDEPLPEQEDGHRLLHQHMDHPRPHQAEGLRGA